MQNEWKTHVYATKWVQSVEKMHVCSLCKPWCTQQKINILCVHMCTWCIFHILSFIHRLCWEYFQKCIESCSFCMCVQKYACAKLIWSSISAVTHNTEQVPNMYTRIWIHVYLARTNIKNYCISCIHVRTYIRTWNYLPLLKQGQLSLLIQGHLSYLMQYMMKIIKLVIAIEIIITATVTIIITVLSPPPSSPYVSLTSKSTYTLTTGKHINDL